MPSPALTSIRKLRRLAVTFQAGDEDARWLAERLARYLADADRGLTLDMALDLAPLPGVNAWWTDAAIEARDSALRELVERFHAGRKVASAAYQIERLAARYATSAWRFDRDRPAMPERYAGTEAEPLWRAFKAGAVMPLAKRQIQTILAIAKRADAA